MSELRYQSTGKPVFERQEMSEEELEARRRRERESSPRYLRAKTMEEIAEHRAQQNAREPKREYETAIKYLDGNYKDLTSNPSTLTEYSRRLHASAIDAAEKGRPMNWLDEGTKIGEQMRQEMGAPTSDERRRAEAIAEFKRSRGLE